MILKRNGSWLLWWEGSCKDRLGGIHEVNKFPEQRAWKARGTEFHEFLQLGGRKAWRFPVSGIDWDRAQRHCAAPRGKTNNPGSRELEKSNQKSAGAHGGENTPSPWSCP